MSRRSTSTWRAVRPAALASVAARRARAPRRPPASGDRGGFWPRSRRRRAGRGCRAHEPRSRDRRSRQRERRVVRHRKTVELIGCRLIRSVEDQPVRLGYARPHRRPHPAAAATPPIRRGTTPNRRSGPPASSSRHWGIRSSDTPVAQHSSAIAAATGSMRIGSANRHASVPGVVERVRSRSVPAQVHQRPNQQTAMSSPAARSARPTRRSASTTASSHSPTISCSLAREPICHTRQIGRSCSSINGMATSSSSAATSSRRCSTSK